MRKTENIRRNANQWQKIINEQELSGQSVASYCREKNLNEKSFYAWRRRLIQDAPSSLKNFIEVSSCAKGIGEPVRIKTPGGYWIEVSPGTESSFVKDVISALESK